MSTTDTTPADPAPLSSRSRASQPLSILARWAPWAILAYAAALTLLRVGLSPYLELDEARLVGQAAFQLIYEDGRPPLFHWLTRVALELTRWNWAWALAFVKYGLLAAFYILTFDAARRLGGSRAGLLALAAAAASPQIVWMSAHTMAYSLLAMTGVAATAQATAALKDRAERIDYVWLGVATALGALGSYNYYLFAAPFFVVMFCDREMRGLFWRRRAIWAAAVFVAAVGPSLVAAGLAVAEDPARLLSSGDGGGSLAWLDVEGVGLDGLAALLISAAAWVGPCLLLWAAARRWDRAQSRSWRGDGRWERRLRYALLGGLGLFALIVAATDRHEVIERDLTPILAAAPIYLAVAWPLGRSASGVIVLAVCLFGAALAGFWAMATYGQHRYGYPYDYVAAQILRAQPQPARILSPRHDDEANLTLALGWPGARAPEYAPLGARAVLVWRGRGEAPSKAVPDGFGPAAGIVTVIAPLTNESGVSLVYRFQLFERTEQPGAR